MPKTIEQQLIDQQLNEFELYLDKGFTKDYKEGIINDLKELITQWQKLVVDERSEKTGLIAMVAVGVAIAVCVDPSFLAINFFELLAIMLIANVVLKGIHNKFYSDAQPHVELGNCINRLKVHVENLRQQPKFSEEEDEELSSREQSPIYYLKDTINKAKINLARLSQNSWSNISKSITTTAVLSPLLVAPLFVPENPVVTSIAALGIPPLVRGASYSTVSKYSFFCSKGNEPVNTRKALGMPKFELPQPSTRSGNVISSQASTSGIRQRGQGRSLGFNSV